MSRTRKILRSLAWWGDWALWFTRENRETRRRGRDKRRRMLERDARLEADREWPGR